jgi:hypothetical protein
MTSQTTPVIKQEPSAVQRLNALLDEHVLPYPVRFLTNRVIILATLALLVPLFFFTGNQSFVNVLNSYLNVMSVVVSSTVLLYATISDVRDRAAAKRADDIAKTYEQVLEDRIQERQDMAKAYEQVLEDRVQGREEIAKTYEQVLEDRIQERQDMAKAYEQVLEDRVQGREEIAKAYEQVLEERVQADHELIQQILQNSIENILGGRLEKIRVEDHKQLDEMQKAVIASNEALRAELAEKAMIASNESLRAELAELRELVQALYQSHFGKPTVSSD